MVTSLVLLAAVLAHNAAALGHWDPRISHDLQQELSACPAGYLVGSDDSCGSIAAKFAISITDFEKLNPAISCAANSKINAADVPVVCTPFSLQSGSSSGSSATNSNSTLTATTANTISCDFSYTLQKGDTCDAIAKLFNVSPKDTFTLNSRLNCVDSDASVGKSLCLAGTVKTANGTKVGSVGGQTVSNATLTPSPTHLAH
ncbi:hypothetical protein BCR33DRAFT_173183 [Rhizoclosmatium globosum]|uniref:LysM domain-containing protein n=1 Tax=Rhizoclosmatium globosum TaxID=329046 RepID=A0A1Y2CF91_9FUNG|nr:hypothetical protein BCR33DRAFT_173183 [Rhizoclosmatium globosum]|eukprot:ORY45720.1 hypothetical protein BCR33DRAFT_173183 [Rhizoclosmatium globosum]